MTKNADDDAIDGTVPISTDIPDDDDTDDDDDDDGDEDDGMESSTTTQQPRQRRAGTSPVAKYGWCNSVCEGSEEISKTPAVTLVLVPTWMSKGSKITLGYLKMEQVSRRGRVP
jgi:hypothetical protein